MSERNPSFVAALLYLAFVGTAEAQRPQSTPGRVSAEPIRVQLIRFADAGSTSILISSEEMIELLLDPLLADPDFRVEVLDARQYEQLGPAGRAEVVVGGFYSLQDEKITLNMTVNLPRTGKSAVFEFSREAIDSVSARLHNKLRSLLVKLAIHSTPSGATVTLDGATLPQKTPLTVRNVLQGKHMLKLELAGHSSVERILEVEDDTLEEVTLQALVLQPTPVRATPVPRSPTPQASRYGYIKVRSVVFGDVYLDGQHIGDTTRLGKIRVLTGIHEVQLRGPGRAKSLTVEVLEGQTHVVQF
jgi:hypothetical protein